jgi:ABC-type nitrate/sulfonate/bicarbonate transport system permease component
MTALDINVADHHTPAWEAGGGTLDLAAQRRRVRRARLHRTALKIAGVLVLLGAWEIGALIINDSSFLPTVQATFSTLVHYLNRPYPAASDPLWKDIVVSGRRILIGFVIAVIGGVLIGAAMWSWRPLR